MITESISLTTPLENQFLSPKFLKLQPIISGSILATDPRNLRILRMGLIVKWLRENSFEFKWIYRKGGSLCHTYK